MRVLLLLALAGTACRTIETRHLSSADSPRVRVCTPERAWEVRRGDELAGRIVLFQEQGSVRDCVYVVRNPWHQDLGLIDGLGRAYRYLPHHREPAWVGSGTVAQGAERILGLAESCRLIEVEEGAAPGVAAPPGSAADPAVDALRAVPEQAPHGGGFPQSG